MKRRGSNGLTLRRLASLRRHHWPVRSKEDTSLLDNAHIGRDRNVLDRSVKSDQLHQQTENSLGVRRSFRRHAII
jgi:hypothetical protein